MPVPSEQECFALMEHYAMLPNIRRHSQVVAAVALELADGLGNSIGRELVLAGALLHDIAKTPCLKDQCDHAAQGAEICLAHDLTEIAPIVAQHVILKNFDPESYRSGAFSAIEIVYYADKRVRHEEIVTLDERLDYIIEHYGQNDAYIHDLIRQNFSRCRQLEDHLFAHLPFTPDEIKRRVTL
jgi:putative nucleotidyltransferase with HDIG domain